MIDPFTYLKMPCLDALYTPCSYLGIIYVCNDPVSEIYVEIRKKGIIHFYKKSFRTKTPSVLISYGHYGQML